MIMIGIWVKLRIVVGMVDYGVEYGVILNKGVAEIQLKEHVVLLHLLNRS